jgi:hypothetical protein
VPGALGGLPARVAAAIALRNARRWLNRRLGRGPLQTADLIAW